MKIRKLDKTEHLRTKALYQEVFPEDSQAFVDYYYQYKAAENHIYAVEDAQGEILSMLHLNPYQINLSDRLVSSHYIVAVATREEWRHQGMMRSLLKRALTDMYTQKERFTFLMPAAEAIYRPFGFHFIYRQNQKVIAGKASTGNDSVWCRPAQIGDLETLSAFASNYLHEKYCVYALHTSAYFKQLLAEQSAQNGQVILILENQRICGYFFCGVEKETSVREAVIEARYEACLWSVIADYLKEHEKIRVLGFSPPLVAEKTKQVPVIMARIIHLEAMLNALKATAPVFLQINVKDDLLAENTGLYELKIDENGCSPEKKPVEFDEFTVSIGELTALLFGNVTMEELDAPEHVREAWGKLARFHPVFLNEVV